LFFGEAVEFCSEAREVEFGDFFVEFFWQGVDAEGVFFLKKFDLGESLIRKRAGHHETRVSGGTAEIDEATFGEEDDFFSIRKLNLVNLRFDFVPREVADGIDGDFGVEVSDVADDGVVFHFFEVATSDHIRASGGGDEDVATGDCVVHFQNFKSCHRGLQGADRVDFGDEDATAECREGLCGAFSDIAESGDDGDFSGEHDIGGAFDRVAEGFATTVQIVEF